MEQKEQFIIDNTNYPLGKDINGEIGYVKDAQAIVFSILLEIDRICRKNNIPYALAFGSALGLYNYQGFIPWDDDADIAIDYFDIYRLKEAFEKDLSPEFEFVCYEKDNRYNTLIPTFKVKKKVAYMRDKNYLLWADHTKGYEGFFVDIVAFMGMKKKNHFWHLLKSQIQMVFYFISDFIFRHDPKGMKRRMKKREEKLAIRYKDENYVCQSVILPFQIASVNLYPRDIIYPFKEYDFNGVKLYSFNNIKEFSRIRFGEKSLKKEINGELKDLLPQSKRKPLHIKEYHIPKE